MGKYTPIESNGMFAFVNMTTEFVIVLGKFLNPGFLSSEKGIKLMAKNPHRVFTSHD
jgi:hypothetical protein